MRLPRLRFTVRRLAAVVAIVAVVLGGVRLWRLSGSYREMAELHRRKSEEVVRGMYFDASGESYHREWPSPNKEYHLLLKAKYENAAAHPWLPVSPDPPEPK